ncbi:organic hydroperoxide resistance protein [Exiguobacterium sp. Helios]|jgi:Ohr subfamily peroxiredoxin|uniref:organic hydroperoxide resistance protein n=1 Tax=unclassified Exiguobacterium TaxID=2644629 RepID=UPI00103E5183|nr:MULTISPECIES: organic hydroperoxide resistance protein [unclassified Exiguobacterium]QNR21237.1 organic hydroperoxide resistance protein [Exiguobacterium sp. Helios]
MKPMFTSSATAVGGRDGRVVSEDGILDVALAMPVPGSKKQATNPEQLFAAGYSACFDSALNLVARKQGIKHDGSEVTAHVTLNEAADGFTLSVELDVLVRGVSEEQAAELGKLAHSVCPYSRATAGNIQVDIFTRTTDSE